VQKILGKPDSLFKVFDEGDSCKLYLYYDPVNGAYSARTSFVYFDRNGTVRVSSMQCGVYYDNTGSDHRSDTTVTFDRVTFVVPDSNDQFSFRLYFSQYQQLYLVLAWGGFEANLHTCEGVDSIQVFEKKHHKYIQSMVAEENNNRHEGSPMMFGDFNFDGITDISINADGSTANTSSLYWLYEPSKKVFVTSDELNGVSSAQFDSRNKEVISYWRGSCCDHGRSTYKFIHGKLWEVEKLEEASVGDSLLFTKHKLIKGKLRLVESTMLDNGESRLNE